MRDQTLTLAQFRETKIMRVTLVRDIKGLAGLRDQWQPLLNRCRPNHVFMTWEWFLLGGNTLCKGVSYSYWLYRIKVKS